MSSKFLSVFVGSFSIQKSETFFDLRNSLNANRHYECRNVDLNLIAATIITDTNVNNLFINIIYWGTPDMVRL